MVKTSPKIKMFLWKAAKGALPVADRMANRMTSIETKCHRCDARETIPHLLFSCDFAVQVWKLAPLAVPFHSSLFPNFEGGWKAIKSAPSLPPTGITAHPLSPWIIWNIWIARNNAIFNSRVFSPEETIQKAIVDCKEWIDAQEILTRQVIPFEKKTQIRPADAIIFKSDAAWKAGSLDAGLGWVFLDPTSRIVLQNSSMAHFVASSRVAEGLALRHALERAVELGIQKIGVEIDSSQLLAALESKSTFSDLHGIVSDLKYLSSFFAFISFNLIRRLDNVEADSLAKQALYVFVETLN